MPSDEEMLEDIPVLAPSSQASSAASSQTEEDDTDDDFTKPQPLGQYRHPHCQYPCDSQSSSPLAVIVKRRLPVCSDDEEDKPYITLGKRPRLHSPNEIRVLETAPTKQGSWVPRSLDSLASLTWVANVISHRFRKMCSYPQSEWHRQRRQGLHHGSEVHFRGKRHRCRTKGCAGQDHLLLGGECEPLCL